MSDTAGAAGAAATAPARPGAFTALRHRNFRLLWVSLLVSNSGTWLQNVAQDYLVYKLTGRALDLGYVNVARAVALIGLAFFGGMVADRVDRRKMLVFTQTTFALLAALLGLLVQLRVVQVWHVVALSFLSAVLLAFDQPCRLSLVPSLVPRDDLSNAIALNSFTYSGAAAIGPSLAGPLVALVGIAGACYLNALSFAAVIYAAVAMQLPARAAHRGTEEGGGPESVLGAMLSGLRYVFASPPLLLLIGLLIFFSLLAAPYQTLLPVFNGKLYGGSVSSLGWLRAAPGAGSLVGGFLIAHYAHISDKHKLLLLGSLGFVAAVAAFCTVSLLPLALLILILVGALSTTFMSTVQTLLQRLADERMRGRVMSLYTIGILGMMPLGALPLSWAADHIGVRWAVAGAALLAAACMTIALLRSRQALATMPR